MTGAPTQMVGSVPLKVLTAPNDAPPYKTATWSWPYTNPSEQPIQQTFTNYVPNARVFGNYTPSVGFSPWNIVWNNAGGGTTSIPAITDGTSNTIAVMEKQAVSGAGVVTFKDWGDTTAPTGQPKQNGVNMWAVTDTQPEGVAFFGTNCQTPVKSGGGVDGIWWMGPCTWSNVYNSNTWTGDPPTAGLGNVEYYNPPKQRPIPSQQIIYNIYAFNSGGSQGLMCDGSVRMFTTSVAVPAWSAAVTPAGGEAIPLN
jgi:hypothetical protein